MHETIGVFEDFNILGLYFLISEVLLSYWKKGLRVQWGPHSCAFAVAGLRRPPGKHRYDWGWWQDICTRQKKKIKISCVQWNLVRVTKLRFILLGGIRTIVSSWTRKVQRIKLKDNDGHQLMNNSHSSVKNICGFSGYIWQQTDFSQGCFVDDAETFQFAISWWWFLGKAQLQLHLRNGINHLLELKGVCTLKNQY